MEKVTFPLPEGADRFYYVVWFQQSMQKGAGKFERLGKLEVNADFPPSASFLLLPSEKD